MAEGRRYFTYQRAIELLPQVIALLQSAIASKLARQKSEADLAAYKQRLVMAGGAFPNNNRIAAYTDLAKTSYESMKNAIDTIQTFGVEVRDLDQGLIDFPAIYQGGSVYLCYQLGESTVSHWHPENAGFAGRRPITQDFIDQLEA